MTQRTLTAALRLRSGFVRVAACTGVLLAASQSLADEAAVSHQAISLPQGAGTIEGMGESFSTQLSTGAATMSLPFALPKGRGGASPSLALSYASTAGHGVAGLGWSVSVPFIARQTDRGSPGYHDPEVGGPWHPEQDRFVFGGGQELIPIGQVQGGGCAGALPGEVMPGWADGWQYFRARVEGSYLRFFWSPDHRTWRVQSKSGTTLELGVPLDGSGYAQALEVDPDDLRHIYRWNLARQFDAQGNVDQPVNVTVYRYLQDRGTAFLSDIFDTPPVHGGTLALSAYAHHTRLVYEPRTDPTFSYVRGWRADAALRLKRVDVSSRSFTGDASRQMVRRYHLAYDPKFRVSFLTSVQMEGRCPQGVSEGSDQTLAEETACPRLPATSFNYQHVEGFDAAGGPSTLNVAGFEAVDARMRTFAVSPPHPINHLRADLFDINADGLPDLLVTNPLEGNNHGVFFQGAAGAADSFAKHVTPMAIVGDDVPRAQYLSLDRRDVTALDADGDGVVDLIQRSDMDSYRVYSPLFEGGHWVWRGRAPIDMRGQRRRLDWMGQRNDVRVMDVNGDGLVDFTYTGGEDYQTFFSLGRFPGGQGLFGQGKWTGAASADLLTEPARGCVPFSNSMVRFMTPGVFLADLNGDGLPDVVRLRGNIIDYWPGRGNGTWGTGKLSECTNGIAVGRSIRSEVTVSMTDLRGKSENIRFEDVNGDGLDDLIEVRGYMVKIWLNVNGVAWAPERITLSTVATSSTVDRVRIVDINGSGTRDIVWGFGDKYLYADLSGGKRAGLLTHVDNGLGKTTELAYASSTELMLAAEREGAPWTSKMPIPVPVIVRKTERDNLERAGGKAGVYVTEHRYRDPVYDGRQREFRGFRSATTTQLGDASGPTSIGETTFLLGECEYEGVGPNPCTLEERWRDNPREALKGLPVVSETHDAAGVTLSTTHHTYRLRHLYTGLDGREVRHAFVSATDVWTYDTGPFAPGGNTVSAVDVELETAPGQVAPGTPRDVPLRSSKQAHVRTEHRVDPFGSELARVHHGHVGRDEVLTRHTLAGRPPQDATGWMFRTESSYVEGSQHSGTWHKRDYAYDAHGNLTETSDELSGTLPLDRFHEDPSRSIAPAPPGASRDGMIRAVLAHDRFGNVVRVTGSAHRCASLGYDPQYAELLTEQTTFTGPLGGEGCGTVPLRTAATYDRGFGVVTSSTGERGERTTAEYDGFGRVVALFKPSATELGAVFPAPALRVDYQVTTDPSARPYSVVHVQTPDGAVGGTPRHSYAYVDGLGRTVMTLAEADPGAGDKAPWIAQGWVLHNAKGQVERAYEPTFTTLGPSQVSLAPPVGAAYVRNEHDAFGRVAQSYGLDLAIASKTFYHGQSTEVWDAADLGNGPHRATPTTAETDGHGRTVRTIERASEHEAMTETRYHPGGEPESITRSGGAHRAMRYDSLGRLVLNLEPTTSSGTGGAVKAWRYAYDDASEVVGTSDARGCGVNTHYDTGGRLIAEDYSPCLKSHADYTAPNLETGDGTEVFNRYDNPSSDPDIATIDGFAIDPQLYLGRAVSTSSRGAKSVLAYDPRGRPSRVARRIVKPGEPSRLLSERYAPRWYAQSIVFDEADRPVFETTGAESGSQRVDELLGADNTSTIATTYTQRGVVRDVGGSYGPLVTKILRNALGHPTEVIYGDRAHTTTEWKYDVRNRVSQLTTHRVAPAEWGGQPPSESFARVLDDATFEYDEVDNPVSIRDGRISDEWSEGGKPVHRHMEYDALYRLKHIAYDHGSDVWKSPFHAESEGTSRDPKQGAPAPHVGFDGRVREQSYAYDALGNLLHSDDDEHAFFDRSLGTAVHDPNKPYQLTGASHDASFRAGSLGAAYDAAGNMTSLAVLRKGTCVPVSANCNQRYMYEWDEVGQLARARRWDGEGSDNAQGPPPASKPEVELTYAYDEGGQRTLKTALSGDGTEVHSAYIFGSLELRRALWSLVEGNSDERDYERSVETQVIQLNAHGTRLGRITYGASDLPSQSSGRRRVFLELVDPLGSTNSVIDKDTGELVERITYQAYGGVDSDVRPDRWKGFREDYRFTGKEEDVEVGLVYFGARYYAPALGRWISPDLLAVHELGADLNLYAYVHGRVLYAVDPWGLEQRDAGAPDSGRVVTYHNEGTSADGKTSWDNTATTDAPPAHAQPQSAPTGSVFDSVVNGVKDAAAVASGFLHTAGQMSGFHVPMFAPNDDRSQALQDIGSGIAQTLGSIGQVLAGGAIALGGGAAAEGAGAALALPSGGTSVVVGSAAAYGAVLAGAAISAAGIHGVRDGFDAVRNGVASLQTSQSGGRGSRDGAGRPASSNGGSQDKGRPTNNTDQNDQARDAIRSYERQSGRRFSRDQKRQAHEEFGRHENPNYHDLIEILRDTFGE